jgi:hypothetical protein
MESDEYETINSIENWLAAPLDDSEVTSGAAVIVPPFGAPFATPHGQIASAGHFATPAVYGAAEQHPVYGAIQNGTGRQVPPAQGMMFGGPQDVSAQPGPGVAYGAAAGFGLIARGEGLHVSGRYPNVAGCKTC